MWNVFTNDWTIDVSFNVNYFVHFEYFPIEEIHSKYIFNEYNMNLIKLKSYNLKIENIKI